MASSDESDFEVLAQKDLTDYNDAGYLAVGAATLAAIQTWLSPTKYLSENSEYRKHLNSYLEGTCQWFEKSKAYQEWHDNADVGALWVKAVAGAGKSVLAASTAARLARHEQVPVLFFFFRQIVALNHEPRYAMRDWLSQLLPFSPWLQNILKQHVNDKTDINTISLDELWRYICDALSFMPKAYCIADALDEMDDDNEAFLKKLVELGRQKPASIKVLLTSRPVPRIENILRSHVSQIRLDPEDVESDVDMYVEFRLKPIGGPPTFYETLKPIICNRAQGLFLYARLVTDQLIDAVKDTIIAPEDIPKIVESVPVSLEDVYNKMLIDHSRRSGVRQEDQFAILQWVTHSVRPLRLIEAAAVMKAIGGAGTTLKETKALVRAACGPLLEVLEDETLSVIHHSFTEYLTQLDRQASHFPIISHDATHRLMAATCVKYLKSGSLSEWEIRKPIERDGYGHRNFSDGRNDEELKLKHPLLEYAISNWDKHAAKIPFDEPLMATLDDFFKHGSHDFVSWMDLRIDQTSAAAFTPIHAAAWVGVAELIEHFTQRGDPADKKDMDSRTPLSYAAANGHSGAVATLLVSGVDPDSDDCVGWRPIHYAARANHHKVVRLLLDAGVNPLTPKSREHPGMRCGNSRGSTGTTALEYAAIAGHAETVKELMPHLEKEPLERALHWAAKNARAEVVAALLQCDKVDVDNIDTDNDWRDNSNYGYTALFQATMARNPATMRILLEKGANIVLKRSIPTGWGIVARDEKIPETLMHAFAGKGRGHYDTTSDDTLKEAFNLLLKAGCPIDSVDNTGRTPLLYACYTQGAVNCPALILMLLESGADASKLTEDGSSVFHLYTRGYSPEVVNALVAHGANIDAIVSSGANAGTAAIHVFMDNYSEEVILAFLDHRPNVNVRNSSGQTALHLRAKKTCTSDRVIAKLLLLGADVNARDNLGQTPLHALSADRSLSNGTDSAQMLIDAGADLDAMDHEGRTLLSLALNQYRCEEAIAMVLKLGANIAVRNVRGQSICHLAVPKLETKTIKFLVKNGADPFATDNDGNTLLHELAMVARSNDEKKYFDMMQCLLELEVSPKTRNHRGYNALHMAASIGSNSFVELTSMNLFLDRIHDINVNEADNYGVTPLHIAASISESHVVSLLKAGADPYLLTYESQSALHVAARGRQSNIVGFLVRIYEKDGRLDVINTTNKEGRTALHDACRSGRPETVQILIEAGADMNKLDRGDRSLFHACAEIMDERALWHRNAQVQEGARKLQAANIMINDPLRPISCGVTHSGFGAESEDDLLRVREIIRLLIANGAKYDGGAGRRQYGPLQLAISKAFEPMIQELLDNDTEEVKDQKKESNSPLQGFHCGPISSLLRNIYVGGAKQIMNSVKDFVDNATNKGEHFQTVLPYTKELLLLGHDQAASQMLRLSANESLFKRHGFQESVVQWLATKGYAQILKDVAVGKTLEYILHCDDPIWAEAMEKQDKASTGSIGPVLLRACHRSLPNIQTLKVLVDDLGVDVNAQNRSHVYHKGTYQDLVSDGPLHVLAAADYWWQSEALAFLLQRNANTELRNTYDQTPLHVALDDRGNRVRKYKHTVVDLLLKHNADVNAVDEFGMSCLNYAVTSPDLIRLLVQHGANVNGGTIPPIHSAVQGQNVDSIATLIELGANVNAPFHVSEEMRTKGREPASEMYPLHSAARQLMDSPRQFRVERRTEEVALLLKNGADPYRVLDNETTIIHHIFGEATAVVLPFFDLPDLKIESRDPKGRTLLLAACARLNNYSSLESILNKQEGTIKLLLDRGAIISATDHAGKSVLHLLLENSQHRKSNDLVTMLVTKYPSLVHIRDKEGCTPLHYALRFAQWWAARLFVDAGANLLDPDPEGSIALHFLAAHHLDAQHELFQSTLSVGADINAKTKKGNTPLSCFLANVRLDIDDRYSEQDGEEYFAQILDVFNSAFLAKGADAFTKDNEGNGLLHVLAKKTPMKDLYSRMRAEDNGKNLQEMFRMLVGMGLDPWGENERQMTPLDVAAIFGNDSILKMFRKEK